MPVSFQDHDNAPTCMLAQWEIQDIGLLVKALAWLYLRMPRHAAKVIGALSPGEANFPGNEFEAARELLSWSSGDIAAALQSSDKSIRHAAENKRDKRIEQARWTSLSARLVGGGLREVSRRPPQSASCAHGGQGIRRCANSN